MYFRIILFVFAVVFVAQNLLCQSTPLLPKTNERESDLGILLGLGMNFQSGDFYTTKDCKCLFSDGNKLGYSFGAFYQKEFANSLKWGIMLLFESKSINSSYRIKELDEVTSQSTNRSEYIPLDYRYKAETNISMISLLPYLDISLVDFLVTRVGFSVSSLGQAEYTHSKELLQNTARLSTGEVVNVNFKDTDGNVKVIDKTDFQNKISLQFGAFAMLGANINLSSNLYLSPIFQYSFPLTNISDNGNNFKVHSWRFFMQLSLKFGKKMELDD
ncbi:MAG TPA: hypothetical protein PKY56_00550 [Candidatus Kapabacteria bacterium]|nr:hypothetical protein [Candidatus Kapabacteria bacterium]HPO61556.1 hypothetical protein [Candidatus Kapabacteria bacterium]